QLQERRAQLKSEIDEIDRTLIQFQGSRPSPAAGTPGRRGRRGIGQDGMSLREALLKVLAQGPRTKNELLEDVQKIGYRFTATDPMNSLQAFLYGTGKSLFNRVEGRFSLIGGPSMSVPAAARNGTE